MTLNYSTPVVNPRLGSSFAIFASCYSCLVLMLVVMEQLGLSTPAIDELMILMPMGFYAAIGLMTRTISFDDFFVAGQRVPALYSAISLCAVAFGGSIVLGSIGALFFLGIDAIALPLGCFTGLIVMGLLFVPYLRKAGASTLPGFLYLRFTASSLRAAASLLALIPCGLLLIAEIALGSKISSHFLPPPQTLGISLSPTAFYALLMFVSVFLTAGLGGMRSSTWTQCAQFVVFLGILVPLVAVSVMRTNLPLPQLTYGSQLEEIKAREASKGFVALSQPASLSEALPRATPQQVVRPVDRAFSALNRVDFIMLVVCLACGIAAHPALLPKLSLTPTILSSRRSFGWASVIAGFVVLTLPAYAFFTKAMAVESLLGVSVADLPTWSQILKQLGIITLPGNQFDTLNTAPRLAFERDTVALLLPVAGGLPRVFFALTAASALAAVLACASGQLIAIANIVSDDFYRGVLNKTASPGRRLFIARLAMLLCGAVVLFVLGSRGVDPLRWAIAALALSGGTFFAVLVASIWWRGLTAAGALAGIVSGFAITAMYLSSSGSAFFGADALTAGAIGVPVSFANAIVVSLMSGPASEQAQEAVEELRVPAGETLQSRMARLAARTKPARA